MRGAGATSVVERIGTFAPAAVTPARPETARPPWSLPCFSGTMSRRRAYRPFVAAVALVLAARSASAGPLLRAETAARPAAMPSERALTVDAAALADLRTRHTATLEDFPLGADGSATLDLVRITPFDARTRIEEVTATGVRQVPLPDETYFTGSVRGAAESRVLLIAATDGVRGFVVRDGMTYPFGRDRAGTHRVYALRDVDPAAHPGPNELCGNDLYPEAVAAVPMPKGVPSAAATVGPNDVLEVEAAIETDYELYDKFDSTAGVTSYLTGLLAAANVIYERDVKVRLAFTYIRLWSTAADPWNATSTSGTLTEVRTYWNDPANGMDATAGPRDIVHFISGKSVSGGIAYVQAACNQSYGFGVSQVYGAYDLSNPDDIWDVLVFTHEVGHNLGTEHTHCYNPPLDHCYSGESGCYSGPTSLPAGGGTIMSYCHLLAGGLSNVNLLFGPTVSATIRAFVTTAPCLSVVSSSSCGNGTVDAGEQCDDGNDVGGDGCSTTCELEGVCGDGTVTAGEQCDDGNAAGGDGCSATCHVEECGNHVVDPGEECDDGNGVSGDGCSATCEHEPLCGDAILDDGEDCDDGNTTSGDGCSATCRIEPCQIVIPHQATWAPAKLVATPGMVALHARFGVESDALDLQDVADGGLSVMVDGATGARAMDVTVPGGTGWTAGTTRVRYRDASGSAAGVRSIVIRAHGSGVTTVDIKLASHGGAVPDANDTPPTVTVLLGDETAGEIGACGRFTFDGAHCVKRGKKLTCK
jgi:cysteine-rich repeat protein